MDGPTKSAPSHLTELSRKYRARAFWTKVLAGSKRKRPTTASACFEVRPTPTKGGSGIFATRDVASGEVLVHHERPLVCILSPGNPNACRICHYCLTPLGALECQLGTGELPNIGMDYASLVLTDPKDLIKCNCGFRWCSSSCFELERVEHGLLCGDPEVNEPQRQFRDFALENVHATQLLLTGQVMATVVGAVIRDIQANDWNEWADKDLFWWTEYSHPLWWEIHTADTSSEEMNERAKARRKACETSCAILKAVFRLSVRKETITTNKQLGETDCLESIVARLCTVKHVGEILGMLQCNVMEIEFPSPVHQFMSHIEQLVEEEEDEDRAQHFASWEERYISKRSGEYLPVASEDHAQRQDLLQPITGSGLFPILTLANHDCDPNASIEFLGESHEGSLVALRDICSDEEIHITYIPNGDFDCGDADGLRFRNFKPTRTWSYLNKQADSISEGDDDEEERPEDKMDRRHANGDSAHSEDDAVALRPSDHNNWEGTSSDNGDGEDELPEGLLWNDRASTLSEYGFCCRCPRCTHEKKESSTSYFRESSVST